MAPCATRSQFPVPYLRCLGDAQIRISACPYCTRCLLHAGTQHIRTTKRLLVAAGVLLRSNLHASANVSKHFSDTSALQRLAYTPSQIVARVGTRRTKRRLGR
ncbi:hypothetical protein NDU88_004148 [Pleurodeles waltl]|uniref:Uncharacterized protein n=1 Tax=Pleurodeles waltl TaxID=8319 RepID=A0AAV7RFV9_PLEWA|nr:hypothetical protein NDU88_004148 [Pleurodeles waltl]